VRGYGSHHVAAPEPVLTDVLIVDHQIEEKPLGFGKCWDDPGGKAVGIDGDPQGGKAGVQAGQVRRQGAFKQRDFIVVTDETQAGGGGGAGAATTDEQAAGRLFQRLDPLADCRGGDMKLGRRKVEGPTAMHGGKGGELGAVQH
jgi:hypothetical protein